MKTLPFLTTNEYDDMALDIIVMLKNYEYSEEEIVKILNYALNKINSDNAVVQPTESV